MDLESGPSHPVAPSGPPAASQPAAAPHLPATAHPPDSSHTSELPRPLRRRRGAQLERELLDAAWAELAERGYANLTFESVASRAGTSRSVVYRRWPARRDLVLAALRPRTDEEMPAAPDTGSLRDDLLAILRGMTRRVDVMLLVGVQLGEFYRETGIAPYALREHWLGGGGASVAEAVRRAVDRGEADAARATPRAVRLASDLLRQEVTTTLRTPSEATLVAIVDEVVVPLLTGRPPQLPERTSAARR